jgi:putative nucleotidyltransferase with HDIG domain
LKSKEGTLSRAEIESINQWFPLVSKIKDATLRQKVVGLWVRIWRESGYKELVEAPNLPSEDHLDENVVSHTNAVTKAALALADQIHEHYKLDINFDLLLGAAILHDIDKPVTLKKGNDGVGHSELGKTIPHGTYGAYVALEAGIPTEIVNVICTHTKNSTAKPGTVEGVIVYHADVACISALRAAQKRPPGYSVKGKIAEGGLKK